MPTYPVSLVLQDRAALVVGGGAVATRKVEGLLPAGAHVTVVAPEVTEALRALDRPDARTVAVIAMTANAFAEDVRASLECGMDAHLSKPIDMRRVLREIAIHLQKRSS